MLVRGFLAEAERAALLAESAGYPSKLQKPVMGMPTLRANAWFADDARAVYEYTGQRWVPAPLTPLQIALRDRLDPMLGTRMNAVLAAYYPHGGAGIGYHADNEATMLGSNPTIVSLSIGATRTFKENRARFAWPPAGGRHELPAQRRRSANHARHLPAALSARAQKGGAQRGSPAEPFLPERSPGTFSVSGRLAEHDELRQQSPASRACRSSCGRSLRFVAFRADARAHATRRGVFRFRRATAGRRRPRADGFRR